MGGEGRGGLGICVAKWEGVGEQQWMHITLRMLLNPEMNTLERDELMFWKHQ